MILIDQKSLVRLHFQVSPFGSTPRVTESTYFSTNGAGIMEVGHGFVQPHTRGGVVLVVSIKDPSFPLVLERVPIPGHIQNSQLLQEGAKQALFVVAIDGDQTYVKAFDTLTANGLAAREEIRLGHLSAIRTENDHLVVARNNGSESEIAVVKFSTHDVLIKKSAWVPMDGLVTKKNSMSFEKDVLRVFSFKREAGSPTINRFQTFDFSHTSQITLIDEQTVATGEGVQATLFLRNRAYFFR